MSHGDVHTRPRSTGWENTVDGYPSLDRTFTRREDAVRNGDTIAETLNSHHHIEEAPNGTNVPDHIDGS